MGQSGRAIPTRVGKSYAGDLFPDHQAGHPHAGGEIWFDPEKEHMVVGPSPRGWGNRNTSSRCCGRPGPSPRGWGNPRDECEKSLGIRAIPTRVGKSCRHRARSLRVPGHPHAGGEIAGMFGSPCLSAGPSPRGWGNQLVPPEFKFNRRAIPTRVGKSTRMVCGAGTTSGHPHAGGEIAITEPRDGDGSGPSPRGWGNRRQEVAHVLARRAIPTRVGKSPL